MSENGRVIDLGMTTQLESTLRREIALSWRRSTLSGLSPEHTLDAVGVEDVDRHSRLLDAASPVLDRIARDLDGTGYCVLLADRDARLIDMRFGQPRIESLMAHDGAQRGRRFSEDNTGTNAIATVFEIRKPLAVRGDEHFVEALKKFTCYGVPIVNPITGRLDGVLDLTALTELDSPLLGAFVNQAAIEMQNQLLERSRASEHELLRSFHTVANRRVGHAVVGVSPGVFLENPYAETLLDQVDRAALRSLAEDARHDTTLRMTLSSGPVVDVNLVRVSRGAVMALSVAPGGLRAEGPRIASRRSRETERPSGAPLVVVRGEAGTGKTHTAQTLHPAAVLLRCDELAECSTQDWLAKAVSGSSGEAPLIIDDVHLLPPMLAHRLAEMLDDRVAPTVLTHIIGPPDPDRASLLSRATHTIDLPSLRARPDRIAPLAREILAAIDPARRISESALAELTRRSWPGNVSQLALVLRSASDAAPFGEIGIDQLGTATPGAAAVMLSPLERAERDTITSVLTAHGHNKRRTARELHISRTTLYKRMRELGIPG